MSAEARLKELGLTLPTVPPAVANYLPYRVAGNLLFLAGQGPRGADGSFMTGKVGGEVSVEEGHKRARIIGLQLLSAMKMALGSLDRVDTVLKMLCMVNAVPDFKDHPKVADGMSTCSSRCSARTAGTPARRSVWGRCRTRSRWRSKASSQLRPRRRDCPHGPIYRARMGAQWLMSTTFMNYALGAMIVAGALAVTLAILVW
jgi:enamine deaminase RidA (YjgF/YER057c/UK114 family)